MRLMSSSSKTRCARCTSRYIDSIPEYIENMEKLQEQSERADNKIEDSMLSTEHFLKANND